MFFQCNIIQYNIKNLDAFENIRLIQFKSLPYVSFFISL